jgi:hypothetical protein
VAEPMKNRLRGYEVGWLTLLLRIGVATEKTYSPPRTAWPRRPSPRCGGSWKGGRRGDGGQNDSEARLSRRYEYALMASGIKRPAGPSALLRQTSSSRIITIRELLVAAPSV